MSFWIFLIAAIFSCVPSLLDHGETLKNFKSSSGLEKKKYGLRLFLLWSIPISFLIATVISEKETERAATESNSAFGVVSNQLQQAQGTVSGLESKVIELNAAIPPRMISESQRENFLRVLLNSNNVAKIPIKIIVSETDPETTNFANGFRKMLNEAGYGTNEEIVIIPELKIRTIGENRTDPIVGIYSSTTPNLPTFSLSSFPSVMMFYPTKITIANIEDHPPIAYHYTEDPNDILRGICFVLNYVGFTTGRISSYGILQPGEIAFFIPKQVP